MKKLVLGVLLTAGSLSAFDAPEGLFVRWYELEGGRVRCDDLRADVIVAKNGCRIEYDDKPAVRSIRTDTQYMDGVLTMVYHFPDGTRVERMKEGKEDIITIRRMK